MKGPMFVKHHLKVIGNCKDTFESRLKEIKKLTKTFVIPFQNISFPGYKPNVT